MLRSKVVHELREPFCSIFSEIKALPEYRKSGRNVHKRLNILAIGSVIVNRFVLIIIKVGFKLGSTIGFQWRKRVVVCVAKDFVQLKWNYRYTIGMRLYSKRLSTRQSSKTPPTQGQKVPRHFCLN